MLEKTTVLNLDEMRWMWMAYNLLGLIIKIINVNRNRVLWYAFLFLSESNPVFHTHYLYKYITGTTVHIWKDNNKLPNDYDSMEIE